MSSSRFGEGMMVSLRSTLDYSTVVYATIGAIGARPIFGACPGESFHPPGTPSRRSGVARDHVDHLLVVRIDDHELVVEQREIVRFQRGHPRGDLGRHR